MIINVSKLYKSKKINFNNKTKCLVNADCGSGRYCSSTQYKCFDCNLDTDCTNWEKSKCVNNVCGTCD